MKRYILFLLIALCSMGVYAQSKMTDNQVMELIVKEHKKGSSQAQIVTKLMQSGVDINQIRRVKKMYERMQNSTSMDPTTSSSVGSSVLLAVGAWPSPFSSVTASASSSV